MATKVIRVEKEVPEVYVSQSRDFQLLCRLINTVFSGVKFNIDRAKFLQNPRECAESYLDLLANKYGFEYSSDIYSDEMRVILDSFKLIVMYKGSKKGICEAINCFSYLKKMSFNYDIRLEDDGDISIVIYHTRFNVGILDDILKYVMPTGCQVNYRFSLRDISINDTGLRYKDGIEIVRTNVTNNMTTGGKVYNHGQLFVGNTAASNPPTPDITGAFNISQIPNQGQINAEIGGSIYTNKEQAVITPKPEGGNE